MAGTALDLTGINVSQAVEKMNNQILDAAKFDFQMKEKRRLEFMSDMELMELNQGLNDRNSDIALKKIETHKEKWAGIYAEKNGRITDKDRFDMLKDKREVERTIMKINGVQQSYEEGLQQIRRGGGKWDIDKFHELAGKWIESGDIPENGFLHIRPVNFRNALRTTRNISSGNIKDTQQQWNPATRDWDIKTTTEYASNEDRDNFIAEQMLSDEGFATGVLNEFNELPDEERAEYMDKAEERGINHLILYAQESGRPHLWQDNTVLIRRDDPRYANSLASGGRSSASTLNPVVMNNVQFDDGAGNITAQYESGYHLGHLKLTTLPGQVIGRARNLETGEVENINNTEPISNLVLYVPKSGKMVVQIRKKNHRPYVIENGVRQYAVIRGGNVVVFQGSKEEADAESQKFPNAKVEAMREKSQTAEVNYEVNVDEHPALMEMIKTFNLPNLSKSNKKSLYGR